jgi:3-phenylpropionate/trans-cinnamate dioxygenase ferredoxin reductase subunit
MKTFVIVGASLAGAKAAEALREEGFDGRIVLLGEEQERPYERPPLSKEYMQGKDVDSHVHEADFYEHQQIELRTGAQVEAIDPQAGAVTIAGGERLDFDALLLATGARPRRLPVDGADLPGVFYLRTLEDAARIRERLESGARVAIVGAGWIGCEVGASARQRGADVTMVDITEVPLERVLGRELGGFYGDVHRSQGVEFIGGAGVERIEGGDRAERVILSDGKTIEADTVVVGVGVAPRTELAEAAGIDVEDGVRVSPALQSSAPNVYAAGDVARMWHPIFDTELRIEHWANALNQGPAAARSMLGQDVTYDRIPYFYSDQYDVGMEYSGYVADVGEVVIRGSVDEREFIAFWVKDGRVLSGMNVNVWDVTQPIQALVRSKAPVDTARLASTDESLEDLAESVAHV